MKHLQYLKPQLLLLQSNSSYIVIVMIKAASSDVAFFMARQAWRVVRNPVQQCRRHRAGTEYLLPFFEDRVGSDDERRSFVMF